MSKEICPRCGKEQDQVQYVCTCGVMYVDLPKSSLSDVLTDEEASEDRCKWKITYSKSLYLLKCHTDCGNIFINAYEQANGFKFCPYCGKEIKN